MFILVNFGFSENGLWNIKRFNFSTILEAVEAGEMVTQNEKGTGFVVITQDNEMDVVYKENTDDVEIQVFPYICAKRPAVV